MSGWETAIAAFVLAVILGMLCSGPLRSAPALRALILAAGAGVITGKEAGDGQR